VSAVGCIGVMAAFVCCSLRAPADGRLCYGLYYIGFRLIAPPYSLSHAAVGSTFAVYLVGTFSSAWVGDLAGRLGRRNVFWWVGLRARHSRAQASALYLFFYYLGSSFAGTASGFFWKSHGWPGVAAFLVGLLSVALTVGIRLIRLRPLPVLAEDSITLDFSL